MEQQARQAVCNPTSLNQYYVITKTLLLYYTHVILFILDNITYRPPCCARRLRPERCRLSPSGKPIGATPQTLRYVISSGYNFDKGFGDIAAASSQYALIARLACSPSLRLYGHVLLHPKKSSIFREPCPPRRLGRSGVTQLLWSWTALITSICIKYAMSITALSCCWLERNGAGDCQINSFNQNIWFILKTNALDHNIK